ncbi:MAG TPA: lytic transglycosylase domain-containing protein [Burkholderiales bacterium]|nr:lytic transglycosylase domain-containing protein [Burkholderiales bacterium]
MIRRSHVFGLVLLAAAAAPASADIYRYIDEEGRAHFTDVRVNSRYELFLKTRPPVVEATPAAAAGTLTIDTADGATTTAVAGPSFRPTHGVKVTPRFTEMIAKVAAEQKVDAALLHAVVLAESGYNPRARSRKGATGLMQVMPDTGKRYGVTDLLNPIKNLTAGAKYLKDLLAMFGNDKKLAIAAYNAGEGAVMRNGNAIPPYAETQAYVPKVLQYYESFRSSL